MSDILNPINVGSIVDRLSHPSEATKDVSEWFETETLEVNFGDYTGRPSSYVTFKQEYLAQFLQTGWTIDDVLSQAEGGNWVQTGGSTSVSKSQSFQPDFQDSDIASSNFSGLDHDLYSQTAGIGSIHQGEPATTLSGQQDPTPVGVSITKTTPSGGAPEYWTAYQRIRLKRRRLVAERVMQSMVKSFTDAYNTGRGIEDERYNDIVSLYSLMLNRSETEGNAIVTGATDLMPLANRMAESVLASIGQADASSDELAESATKNRTADVNRQFDTLVSQTKAAMITNGTYNSTLWPSVLAGIERQRSEALDKANEAGMTVKFNAKQSVSTLKSTVVAQLLSSMQAVASASDQRKITVVELRNSVLKWMLDYIGSRDESYPELEEIATVTERMGFSVGSAGSVL